MIDEKQVSFLKKTFKANQDISIVDLGAADLAHSIFFRKMFKNAKIYAIEPDRDNIEKCVSLAQEHGIVFSSFAISKEAGTKTFYPSLSYGNNNNWGYSGSIFKPVVNGKGNESAFYKTLKFDMSGYDVECVSFDSFCDIHMIEEVDFLHMDAQGAEYDIISGIEKVFPRHIWAETNAFGEYETGVSLKEFDNLMLQKGYKKIERTANDTLYSFSLT
jgi:FkbM family methyltransferase